MQALELMRTHVAKTTPDAALSDAVDLMDLYQTSGLPVIDAEGRLCGMLTESDIARALKLKARMEKPAQEQEPGIAEMRVGEFMTCPAVSALETDEIGEVARRMVSRGVKRVPVVTANGEVVGILTRIDIYQALYEGNL